MHLNNIHHFITLMINFVLNQVTRGGGALTLASQWKSQFDDSEETTDNEWKQEPQVNFELNSFSFQLKRDLFLSFNNRINVHYLFFLES